MMEVKVVEKAKDVFGASVSDFDPWEEGGGFGDDDGDAGFGDFGDFGAMDGENANDDVFFNAGNSGDALKDVPDEENRKIRPPTRKPSSRRGNPSRNNSTKTKSQGEEKEEEKEGSSSSRRPLTHMRRRSSSRLLIVDVDEKDKKDSSRSRSRSADKETSLANGEGMGDEASDKEHSRSGHLSRREGMRAQRNSFRLSKRHGVEESPSPKSASREKSPPRRGVARRQSSSRRLVPVGDASGTRLATQQSVRSLFQNGDLVETDKSPGRTGKDGDSGAGCIVSHSRFSKPARSRSGLAQSVSITSLRSSEGESQRRIGKSASMNRKLDGPASDPSSRRPPQRTRSAVTQRPGSIRRNLNSDNLTLEETPEENEDPLSPIGRPRPPTKAKSFGAVSVRERRHHHYKQESDGGHGSARRSNRRLGSQDGELHG